MIFLLQIVPHSHQVTEKKQEKETLLSTQRISTHLLKVCIWNFQSVDYN